MGGFWKLLLAVIAPAQLGGILLGSSNGYSWAFWVGLALAFAAGWSASHYGDYLDRQVQP